MLLSSVSGSHSVYLKSCSWFFKNDNITILFTPFHDNLGSYVFCFLLILEGNKLIYSNIKNQALQILYLKHHAYYYYYLTLSDTTINTHYNWPAFLVASCLNIGYLSSHELIRIRNYRPHSNTYNIVLNLKWLYSLVPFSFIVLLLFFK